MFFTKKRALKKYEEEKRNVTRRIVMRQSRGNVRIQNGGSDLFKNFRAKSVKADQILKNLLKLVPQT